MTNALKTISIATLVSLTTGCATIMSKPNQAIKVTTTNDKAIQATIDGRTFDAPGMVMVATNGQEKAISVKDKSCKSLTPVKKIVNPMFFGNFILGGPFGSTIDSASGKMWKYQESVAIECE